MKQFKKPLDFHESSRSGSADNSPVADPVRNKGSTDKIYNSNSIYKITIGALFVALFGVVSNIPVLSTLQLIPGVPFSLQPLIIALIAFLLGLKFGLLTYSTILLCTLSGIPMMSGGKGGLAVFVGPTGGYILGWFFIVLFCGIFSSFIFPKFHKIKSRISLIVLFIVAFLLGAVGIMMQYLLGSFVFILSTNQPISSFVAVLIANITAFLIMDLIKIVAAIFVAFLLYNHPFIKRALASKSKMRLT